MQASIGEEKANICTGSEFPKVGRGCLCRERTSAVLEWALTSIDRMFYGSKAAVNLRRGRAREFLFWGAERAEIWV